MPLDKLIVMTAEHILIKPDFQKGQILETVDMARLKSLQHGGEINTMDQCSPVPV